MWANWIVMFEANRRRPRPVEPPDEPPLWVLLLILFGPVVAAALIFGITAWVT